MFAAAMVTDEGLEPARPWRIDAMPEIGPDAAASAGDAEANVRAEYVKRILRERLEATLLGRRNAELEALAAGAPALAQRAAELQRRHDVLLELLGEKAEEQEQVQRDAQADLADVRGLYQQQVADLTTRVLDLKGNAES